MTRRALASVVLAATTTVAVGIVGAVDTSALANPVGIANPQAPCTTTITVPVSSLNVTTGFVCIDGADGGAVNGPVTVAAHAGLYIEQARVGSINAVDPTAVWGCDATTGNINVSGASGLRVHDYYGFLSTIAVSFNVWCLPLANSTGSNLTGATGSVKLVNDAGEDNVEHSTINGSFTDNGNRGTIIANQPTDSSVDVSSDIVTGPVQIQNAQQEILMGGVNDCCDSSTFRGAVSITSSSLMQIALGTFDRGLTLTSDGAGIIVENAFHGAIAFNGTDPNHFELTDNTYF